MKRLRDKQREKNERWRRGHKNQISFITEPIYLFSPLKCEHTIDASTAHPLFVLVSPRIETKTFVTNIHQRRTFTAVYICNDPQ